MHSTFTQRKFIHIAVGTLFLAAVHIGTKYVGFKQTMLAGYILVVIIFVLEIARIKFNVKIPIYNYYLKPKEKNTLSGVFYAVLASTAILVLFDYSIALVTIATLILADPLAALVGRKYGKKKLPHNKKKTVLGTSTLFIIAIILGAIITKNILLTTAMALLFACIESIEICLDDNLTAPIITALVGQIILLFL